MLCNLVIAQFSVVKLLEQAPTIPVTFGKAFMDARLVTSKESLLDGREFNRVKSWEPSLSLKKFGDVLDSYIEKIDTRAEGNSFSLSYVSDIDPETKEYLELMTKAADSLKIRWKGYSKRIVAVCPEFFPLSEEFGCDEITASGQKLNQFAIEKNQILGEARIELKPLFDLVQRYFNKLYLVEDAMTNNEVLNEISKALQVLQDWNYEVNAANSNMVETGISLNNALCGR